MAANVNLPEGFVLDQSDSVPSNNLPQGFVLDTPNAVPQQSEDIGALKAGALGLMSGVPGAETAIAGVKSAIGPTTFDVEHKQLEDLKDKAWEQQPFAYGAGKGAGMVGTGIVAPEGIAGMALTGAGYGADAAKSLSDLPKEAAIGTGTGLVAGQIADKFIDPAISAVANKLGEYGKTALSTLGSKLTRDDIEKYLANPDLINNASTREQIADKIGGLVGDIGTASGHLSEMARNELSTNNLVPIKDIKDSAMDALQKYFPEGTTLTSSDDNAVKTILDQYQKIVGLSEQNNGQVPETALRSIIDRIQAATKESTYGNPEASATQTALKEFGGKLNSLLRGGNEAYTEAMTPSAEAAAASSDLGKGFKLEDGQPTDATFTKLNNLLKENKPNEQELADTLQNMTGTDIKGMLENAKTKENFDAEGAGAGLKTLMTGLGYGAGHATHLPYGGIAGAAAGNYGAQAFNGGSIAKSVIDSYLKGNAGTAIKTYGPILINAAKQGGNNLAATHFVLATSHPEYQKMISNIQDQNQ